MNTVKPSFSHKFYQLPQVTVLPVKLWAISCIATFATDLLPVKSIIEGEANVNKGFSIPPKGKLGGIMTILYSGQLYLIWV